MHTTSNNAHHIKKCTPHQKMHTTSNNAHHIKIVHTTFNAHYIQIINTTPITQNKMKYVRMKSQCKGLKVKN